MPNTLDVQLMSLTSGVLIHSVFCRHVDGTQSLSMDERERFTAQLLTAWTAKWLNVSPAGEDEPLRGGRQAEPSGPQQLPDSGGCHDQSDPDVKPSISNRG